MTTSSWEVAGASYRASEAQWEEAGGHCLRNWPTIANASRRAFAVLQTCTALDIAGLQLREELRELNSSASDDGIAIKRRKPPHNVKRSGQSTTRAGREDDDDITDGSSLQGDLISRNVRPDKRDEYVPIPRSVDGNLGKHSAPDGSLRLVLANVLSGDECAQLIAGGLVAMASAFSRCGQTTLGISPALAGRMLAPPPVSAADASTEQDAASDATIPAALPLLYRTVERVRRHVAVHFDKRLEELRMSDATLTRLQPVPAAGGVDRGSGALDVGLLRGDQFNYWRPHLDKVSVDEYEISALLYLTSQADALGAGGDGGCSVDGKADFEGGRFVWYDEDCNRVVLPEPGVLVAFTSGTPNLHAVERVTAGSRFALTMWFTTCPEPADIDPTHAAMQRWASSLHDADEGAGAPPPPLGTASTGSSLAAGRQPSREEALVSAALCSLPANDPLGRALLLGGPGQISEALSRGLELPPEHAHATRFHSELLRDAADAGPHPAESPPPPETHALLQSQAVTLEAMLTTLRRARHVRAADTLGRGEEAVTGKDTVGVTSVIAQLAHAAPAVPVEDDAFSVFD
jgi:hypothetical protein